MFVYICDPWCNYEERYIAGGINAELFGMKTSDGFEENVDHFKWNSDALDDIVREESPALGDRRPNFVAPFLRW